MTGSFPLNISSQFHNFHSSFCLSSAFLLFSVPLIFFLIFLLLLCLPFPITVLLRREKKYTRRVFSAPYIYLFLFYALLRRGKNYIDPFPFHLLSQFHHFLAFCFVFSFYLFTYFLLFMGFPPFISFSFSFSVSILIFVSLSPFSCSPFSSFSSYSYVTYLFLLSTFS